VVRSKVACRTDGLREEADESTSDSLLVNNWHVSVTNSEQGFVGTAQWSLTSI